MLSKADNEFLTRSGKGTPMGELLRRFWMPALLVRGTARARRPAQEDQDPGRGPAGLPRQQRPGRHRRAALPAPRRQSLLRPQRRVRPALRLPRLEVRRRRQLRRPADLAAGVHSTRTPSSCSPIRCANGPTSIWVYMGPREHMPELPQLELGLVPAAHRYVSKKWQDCNWVQSLEGAHRHRALLVPAQGADQGREGQAGDLPHHLGDRRRSGAAGPHSLGDGRSAAQVRDPGPRHRPGDRRGAQDRQRPTSTGASRSS